MSKSKTSTAVKSRWNAKAYDQLIIRVKKGNKETIKALAEQNGESLNGYISRLIEEDMNKSRKAQKE